MFRGWFQVRRGWWWPSLTLLAFLALSPAARAQTLDRAEVSGSVYDPSGAVVPAVAVRLVHAATGVERVVQTDAAGRYAAALLPIGLYRVRADGGALASAWYDVRLGLGDAITLDLVMAVTELTHTVEVAAPRSSTVAVVNTVTGGDRIAALPTRGRDYREFALLAPTAHPITGTRGTLRLAGQPGDYLALLVDGADFTNGFFGEFIGSLETKNVTIPLEAVEEFQVAATSLRAEYGRSNGGLVHVVTRSGTNTHRGSLAYHLRHHRLTAADAFGNTPAGLVRHQVGGGTGGPVARNRTFYFMAAEFQSQQTPLTVRFSRDVRGVAVPELGIASLSDLEGQIPREETVAALFGRLDHAVTSGHRLTSRLNLTHHSGRNMGGGSLIIPRAISNLEAFSNRGVSWLVSSSRTVGDRLSLETKVQVSYENRPRRPQGEGPQVQIADTGLFGASSVLPVTQDMSRYHAAQHATYASGRHALQAGADYNGFRLQNSTFALARHGVYTFPTLERFLVRQPSLYGQFFGLEGRTAPEAARIDSLWQHEVALYVQHHYRPGSRLTLTTGLRYDAQFNPRPTFGTAGTLVPVGEPRRTGGVVEVQYAPVPQGIPNDTNNFAPRIDAMFDLSGTGNSTAILTAGYYYGRTPMIYFPLRGSGVASTTMFGPPGQFGVTFPEVLPDSILPGSPLERLIPKPSIHYVDPDFQNPRVLSASASLSHGLGDWTVGASYVFSDSRNLRIGGFRSTFWDRNLTPPSRFDEHGRGIVSTSDRPDPSIGQANALASFGRGRYHAMLLRLAKPVGRVVHVTATYTLASSKGNASTERDTEASFGPSDPFNLDVDYGYNELDVRHAFVAHLTATLPGGVSIGSIWSANSGLAFPVYGSADANGDGVQNNGLHPDRPVVHGRLLPRFPYHQPAVFSWDLRAARAVNVGPATWQVMLDVFNVLNNDNLFSDPRTNAIFGSPNFRELNRTHGSRMAQVGVRLEF